MADNHSLIGADRVPATGEEGNAPPTLEERTFLEDNAQFPRKVKIAEARALHQRPSDLRTAAYSSAARATPAASKSGVRVPANSAYNRTRFMGILSSAPIQLAYLPSLISAQALPTLIPALYRRRASPFM